MDILKETDPEHQAPVDGVWRGQQGTLRWSARGVSWTSGGASTPTPEHGPDASTALVRLQLTRGSRRRAGMLRRLLRLSALREVVVHMELRWQGGARLRLSAPCPPEVAAPLPELEQACDASVDLSSLIGCARMARALGVTLAQAAPMEQPATQMVEGANEGLVDALLERLDETPGALYLDALVRGDGALLEALLRSPRVRALASLSLRDNALGDAHVHALAEARLEALRSLSLSGNQIGDQGAGALALSLYFAQVERLELRGNRIGDAGAVALLGARSRLSNVQVLDLADNQIGDAGALTLLESPSLLHGSRLRWLSILRGNAISSAAAARLRAAARQRDITLS